MYCYTIQFRTISQTSIRMQVVRDLRDSVRRNPLLPLPPMQQQRGVALELPMGQQQGLQGQGLQMQPKDTQPPYNPQPSPDFMNANQPSFQFPAGGVQVLPHSYDERQPFGSRIPALRATPQRRQLI
jgi:hypothetical protein